MGMETIKPLRKRILFIIPVLLFSFVHLNGVCSEEIKSFQEGKRGHPKIGSSLYDLKEKYLTQGRGMTQKFAESYRIQMDEEDRVVVFLYPDSKRNEAINAESLKAFGCEIIKSGNSLFKARVALSMLDLIADHVEGVSFIKLPDKPLANMTSEGVSLTRASSYHPSGYYGQNVKVAAIDLGFAGLESAIANGEVPGSVIKIDCTGPQCAPTDFSFEDESHGTAVAEVIHDMAPEAQLYLIKVADSLDLKDAKDFCIANGIQIVNHSVGWFSSNFYDGSCYFDNAVCTANHANRNGILWVNSAGNHARKHYEALFTDRDGDRLHNVTPESNLIAIDAQKGDSIVLTLTWDAWPVTNQDYDLLLLDESLAVVAAGVNFQTGTQPPSEEIVYPVFSSGTYYLAVKKYDATENHRLQIFSFSHTLDPFVASSSLLSPSDASGVLTVAAIDQADWTLGPQEDFSSQGPTTDGRFKPDISGPDGVSNFIYGSFFGTSASSPHVAGAAALILSINPSLTVSQLWNVLTSSVIDIGSAGPDTIYGHGKLDLPATLFTISPTFLDFGSMLVGGTLQSAITVQNVGNPNLSVENISFPVDPFSVVENGCSGKSLAMGEACSITVQFSPVLTGTFTGNFVISSNDPYRSPITVSLNGTGLQEIILSSPSDAVALNSCSLFSPPIFSWESAGSFDQYEIQFSQFPTFGVISVRQQIFGQINGQILQPSKWKKVLQIPGAFGGAVYWRVIGTRANGGTQAVSDTRSLWVFGSGPPPDPVIFPVSKTGVPTLSWENECHARFKVWFGSDGIFSKKRVLSYGIIDPGEGAFSAELTLQQWEAIRKLVQDQSGSTIYWYVESWDLLNRFSATGMMSLELDD
jgi:subtilisin family serine protease